MKVDGTSGEAWLQWQAGPVLTLRRITLDNHLLALVDGADSCRPTTVLGPARKRCVVKVTRTPDGPAGLTRISLEFDDAQGLKVQRVLSFDIAAIDASNPGS